MKPHLRQILILTAVLTLAAPAWGYVVFLKDGKQIVTKEKYKRQGDMVVLIMQSGTTTELPASEVDFAKTDEMNKTELGTAKVLEGGETRALSQQEQLDDGVDETTLSDLAARRSLALPPPAAERKRSAGAQLPYTKAGFIDLERLPRADFPDADVAAELAQYFESQGLEGFEIFGGSEATHPLVVFLANSDTAVFKALKDSASALVQTQARFPGRLAALEVLMLTERKKRAGQFVLTPEHAHELLSRGDAKTFFVRYVQF